MTKKFKNEKINCDECNKLVKIKKGGFVMREDSISFICMRCFKNGKGRNN